MKNLLAFGIIFSALIVIQNTLGKEIKVTVKQGLNSDPILASLRVDDEKTTVRQLADKYMKFMKLPENPKYLRMESYLGLTYNMDKTLKEAGIKDGQTIKIKLASRTHDITSKVVDSIFPTDKHGSDFPLF